MFKDYNQNLRMIQGAYRKLKSYYYYNKNFLMMRKKIADFEYDHDQMERCFADMAYFLLHPQSSASKTYIEKLVNTIGFYAIPKKFEALRNNPDKPISNSIHHNKQMKSVNFFIDAPIEIHILDALWTVLLAKMDYDCCVLSDDVYGNTINKGLFNYNGEIEFDSIKLFNKYYNKYSNWRNRAFGALESNYDSGNDSVLISLDIQSYYYSVRFKFSYLDSCFDNHSLLKLIRPLTRVIEQTYGSYLFVINKYRRDLVGLREGEYPLPIGLFSSMVIGNLYLRGLDDQIRGIKGIRYYGRYVDDILIVVSKSITSELKNTQIIEELLGKEGIVIKDNSRLRLAKYKSLYVQFDKIKIIYMDHKDTRVLIDIYEKTFKTYPSQMGMMPFPGLDIPKFDEEVYNVENFTKEKKIRDIGFIDIDSYKVGRFFSALPRRYSNIDSFSENIRTEINNHLYQIRKFFVGSQSVEFYTQWLNYMYFLVITQRYHQLHKFIATTKDCIQTLNYSSLDRKVYKRANCISNKVQETLKQHLDISLSIALSIDVDFAKKHFKSYCEAVEKYIASNMFEHAFVAFPLANYMDINEDISFIKMELSDIEVSSINTSESFKFIWSPRFIHYHELLLLGFYHYHTHGNDDRVYYSQEKLLEEYCIINHLKHEPFIVKDERVFEDEDYLLKTLELPPYNCEPPQEVKIVVGSIEIDLPKHLSDFGRWSHLTIEAKKKLFDVLDPTYRSFKDRKDRGTIILVLPELCYPIYWINDLIRFSKNNQIAVVTGLQYLGDSTNRKYNYLATILPFECGPYNYRNAFIYIREKNDYSPIEYKGLAKLGLTCRDRDVSQYQVYNWNGIHLTPMDCFELTDIMARAILKGRSDIIAVAEYNRDTTYFSNIIDATARDLHSFIIQANSSNYGDSRVTGPYDRDSKDIFKIKGGENAHVVIGSIQFKELMDYQDSYYADLEEELKRIARGESEDDLKKERPEIKSLPARYKKKSRGIR